MISSPCIRECRMDDRFGLCLGCARTWSEIETWKEASDDARSQVWKELPARREKLGLKTHRLRWTREDIQAFIFSTLKPGGGTWVSGVFGAIAEFCVGADEEIAFDGHEIDIAMKTTRGAISFHLSNHVCAFAIGVSHVASTGIVLLAIPREHAAFAVSYGLTCLAQDGEAIGPESRHESLYDFGLGSGAAGFGIRTADPALAASLNRYAGETYPRFMPAVGMDILEASPTRVIRNAMGRIEVFARIPGPGEPSPLGPHTHFLPEHLKQGADLPPNIRLPEAYVPCFIHYPARPSDRCGDEPSITMILD